MNTVVLPPPTTATLRTPSPAALLRRVAAWWARAAERRRLHAELRLLRALGQHDLNDLGVGRSELDYWAGRPR